MYHHTVDKSCSLCVECRRRTFYLQLRLEGAWACPKCKYHVSFLRRQKQRGLKRHISYSSEGLLEWLLKPVAPGEYGGCTRTFNGLAEETWMSQESQETQGSQGQGKCRAESEQNYLWIGTAVVCVTPRSSLLWSILICYSLNTLNIFYVSFNLSSPEAGLSTHLPTHPKN